MKGKRRYELKWQQIPWQCGQALDEKNFHIVNSGKTGNVGGKCAIVMLNDDLKALRGVARSAMDQN